MNLIILTNIKQLIATIGLIIGCALIIAMIVIVALLKNSYYNRQHNLESYTQKYNDLSNKVYGPLLAYLKRLNLTAENNETYNTLFKSISPVYNKITNTFEPAVNIALENLKKVMSSNYKEYKKALNELKTVFSIFEKNVNLIEQKLTELFTEEDRLKEWVANLTKTYEKCHYLFEINEQSLQILSETFFMVFDGIDENFEKINGLIEETKYQEANELTIQLDKMINELKNGLEYLPSLCIESTVTIPDLIEKVEQKCEEMNNLKIPVHHLHVSATIDEYNKVLKELILNFNSFVYKNAQDILDEMVKGLNILLEQFNQEYESYELVESDGNKIYSECEELEKSFISLKRKIDKVVEYYQIANTYSDYIDKIQEQINEMGNLKRQLDAYFLSSTKQPYSMLVNKMKELNNICNNVKNMINEYNNYIDSLKSDCDKSYLLINDSYLSVKHSEYLLRDLNLKDVYEPQKKTIERIYLLIERLYNSLISMPIDVAAVNRYANEMVSLNTGLKEFVNTVIAQATEVENNVLSANKIRSEVGSFDVALCEAEKDFFKGNFSQANQNALSVIQKPKR